MGGSGTSKLQAKLIPLPAELGKEWKVIYVTTPGKLELHTLRSSAGVADKGLRLVAPFCLLIMPRKQSPGLDDMVGTAGSSCT